MFMKPRELGRRGVGRGVSTG